MKEKLEREDELITVAQAFNATVKFLEAWWKRGGEASEDALWLVSAMDRTACADGGPADPAMWKDFLDAIDAAGREAV